MSRKDCPSTYLVTLSYRKFGILHLNYICYLAMFLLEIYEDIVCFPYGVCPYLIRLQIWYTAWRSSRPSPSFPQNNYRWALCTFGTRYPDSFPNSITIMPIPPTFSTFEVHWIHLDKLELSMRQCYKLSSAIRELQLLLWSMFSYDSIDNFYFQNLPHRNQTRRIVFSAHLLKPPLTRP